MSVSDVFAHAALTTKLLLASPPTHLEDAAKTLEWASESKTPHQVFATGVGKSGIAAQKFAASLAAHGVPAQFLDPVEARHGGLGRLSPLDRIVAFSASGATGELVELALAVERYRDDAEMPFDVGVYGPNSWVPLSQYTTFTLPTLSTPTDDAITNHVPSASFIAQCVVGDALALRVAELNGAAGPRATHPGGNLGRKLR